MCCATSHRCPSHSNKHSSPSSRPHVKQTRSRLRAARCLSRDRGGSVVGVAAAAGASAPRPRSAHIRIPGWVHVGYKTHQVVRKVQLSSARDDKSCPLRNASPEKYNHGTPRRLTQQRTGRVHSLSTLKYHPGGGGCSVHHDLAWRCVHASHFGVRLHARHLGRARNSLLGNDYWASQLWRARRRNGRRCRLVLRLNF